MKRSLTLFVTVKIYFQFNSCSYIVRLGLALCPLVLSTYGNSLNLDVMPHETKYPTVLEHLTIFFPGKHFIKMAASTRLFGIEPDIFEYFLVMHIISVRMHIICISYHLHYVSVLASFSVFGISSFLVHESHQPHWIHFLS